MKESAHGAAALLCQGFASGGSYCLAMGTQRYGQAWRVGVDITGLQGGHRAVLCAGECPLRLCPGFWASLSVVGWLVAARLEGSRLVTVFPSCQLYFQDRKSVV